MQGIASVPKNKQSPRAVPNLISVCVDATSWTNDRGFGRFTRKLLGALAERDTGFRYTLLFDRVPNDPLPTNITVASAATQRTLFD